MTEKVRQRLTVRELRDLTDAAATELEKMASKQFEIMLSTTASKALAIELRSIARMATIAIDTSHMGMAANEILLELDPLDADTCSECNEVGEHLRECSYHEHCPFCGAQAAEHVAEEPDGRAIRQCAACRAEWHHVVRIPARLSDSDLCAKIAEALNTTLTRTDIFAEMTGGNIWCVVVPQDHDDEKLNWLFGMANDTWGGTLLDENGLVVDTVDVNILSDSQHVTRIAKGIGDRVAAWQTHEAKAVQS